MNSVKALREALDRFIYEARDIKRRRALAPIERRLEKAMAKAFRKQGEGFIKRFGRLRGEFQEAIGPSEWEPLFDETAAATFELFAVPVGVAAVAAFEAGAVRQIADLRVKLDFDLKNPRAEAFLRNYGADKVTQINDTTREYLRTVITEGVEEVWSYDRMAQAIIDRYDEFAVGKPQLHIDSRAHLVAVTETANAYEEGSLQVAQELEDTGLEMEHFWQTVGDDRASDGCRENQAAGWIPLKQRFPTESGTYDGLRAPRFPGCRCTTLHRRKPAKEK